MTWGGSYSGMSQWRVTIVHIDPLPRDINDDGKVTLADLVIALRITAGFHDGAVNLLADVDDDGEAGIAEVLYIIHTLQ